MIEQARCHTSVSATSRKLTPQRVNVIDAALAARAAEAHFLLWLNS